MKQGMTLMELLVVIVVIAAIFGILYQALSQARERAHLATCISNLRQLIQAVHMYEQDWGTVPIESRIKTKEGLYGFVQQILFPYVHDSSLFICPAHKGQWFTEPKWKGRKWFMSYAYFVNTYTVNEYGKGNPKLKPNSPLFCCMKHPEVILIARYDGAIEIAPLWRYRSIRAKFEIEQELEEDDELL